MNTLNPIQPSNAMVGYPTTPPTTPPINPSMMVNQQQNQQHQQQNRGVMPQQQPQQAQPSQPMQQPQRVQSNVPLNQPNGNQHQQHGGMTPTNQPIQQTQPLRQPTSPSPVNYQTNQGVQQQVANQQMTQQPQQQGTTPLPQNNYNRQATPVQQTQPMNQTNPQQKNGQWQNNQHVQTGKQILRIDGNGSFVEVMDSKFQEGKVTFQFCNYDKTKPAGQRQTDFIRFNLDFSEFFNLGHQVLHENLMNRQPIDNYNNLRNAYMKGVPSKYNNGQAVARKLEIKNGDRQPIRLICSEGQGEETSQGLIKMVGQAQKRVQVAMSQDAFRSIFLVVPMYIQAYLNNHYDKCVK